MLVWSQWRCGCVEYGVWEVHVVQVLCLLPTTCVKCVLFGSRCGRRCGSG